jgi:hypothetical protein
VNAATMTSGRVVRTILTIPLRPDQKQAAKPEAIISKKTAVP